MPRAIAIFSRGRRVRPAGSRDHPRSPSVICPSSARTKATRLGKPLPTNAASERAASAPGWSARKAPLVSSVRDGNQILGRSDRPRALDRADHSAARGDEPRVRAAPKHRDGKLRDDVDPERVRERPVDDRTANGREAVDTPADRVPVERDEASPVERRELGPDLGSERRRGAFDLDRTNGEHRGLARDRVEASGDQYHADPDRERPSRGRKAQHVELPPAREPGGPSRSRG